MIIKIYKDNIGEVELVDRMKEDTLLKVANSARVSYGNRKEEADEKDQKLSKYLWTAEHTCYDENTEVLTRDGFKLFKNISGFDEFACIETNGKFSGYTRGFTQSFEYTGKLYSFQTSDIDLVVTPNHRLFASLSTTQKNRKNPKFSFYTCEDIAHRPMRMTKASLGNLILDQKEENPRIFALYGFFIGDGYASTKNRIHFQLKKKRKVDFLSRLLNELEINYTVSNNKKTGSKRFAVKQDLIGEKFRALFYNNRKEKVLPKTFMDINSNEFKNLKDGLLNSDGSKKRTTFTYSTVFKELANDLQALFSVNGIACSLNSNNGNIYTLNLNSRRTMPRINDTKDNKCKEENYKGRVYCADIGGKALVIRRNNKIIISGNSPFRHTYYTFRVKIPIFVSRQFLKYQVGSVHRTYEIDGNEVSLETFDLFFDQDKGCSWNEISGRYAKLKPEFYIPDKMRTNSGHGNKQASSELQWSDTQHSTWITTYIQHCNQSYTLYEDALREGIAREIARMYLPVATYTEAYWTVSLQAILWFLHQRLKEDAQLEIRELAQGIKKLIQNDLDKLNISI